MAEKILNTRILMKVDTLENWSNSSLKLKKGELAFATVAASAGTGLTEPVVMVKIGTAEEKTFSELPWAFHAKASDVLAACKSEDALKAFINGVIADAGIATNDAMEALAGRVTTAEGKITTLEGKMTAVEGKAAANEAAIGELETLVGDESVATQITNKIAELKLGETYEAKGAAAAVQTELNTYKTSNDAKVLEHTNAITANTNAITAIKDGETLDSFKDVEIALAGKEAAGAAAAAETAAKAYADGLAGNYDAKGAAATAESNAKAYAKEYADGLAGNYDAAGAAAQALTDAKKYTDDEIAEWVGDKPVAEQIADLDLENTYEAKGDAAKAQAAAQTYADGLNTAMNTRVEALEAIDHEHANKAELDKIVDGDKAKWDAMEQNAKDYADDLDEAMDARVKAIEDKFGGSEDGVGAQIAAAVATETAAREAADTALDNRVKAIEGDYLKAADKTELQGAIDDLEELVGGEAVSAQITKITDPLAGRVKAIEDDYLKAADKTELQGNIDTVSAAVERLTNGVSAEEVDGVNDLIQYVKDHGTEVTGIKADIAANTKAIGEEKARAEGVEGGLDTRLKAVEAAVGESGSVAGDIADALAEAKGYTDTEVKKLADGAVATNAADIAALEGLVGDGNVSERISDAIDTLKNGQLTTMQGEIDAVEGRVEALEAIDHEHANKTVLDGITAGQVAAWDAAVQTVTAGTGLTATKTGTDVAIAFDDTCVFIFDCGDSSNV